jgi:heat shock protein HslJ
MIITSCQDNSTPNISDHEWEVITINDTELSGTLPTLSFDLEEGKVNGNASCNNFFGSVEIVDSSIKFGMIGATKMMCPDMNNEDLLFQHIEKVTVFNFDNNMLILKSDDEITVIKCKIKS